MLSLQAVSADHAQIAVYTDDIRDLHYVEAEDGYCSECMERLLENLWVNAGLTLAESDDELPELTPTGAVRLYLEKNGEA